MCLNIRLLPGGMIRTGRVWRNSEKEWQRRAPLTRSVSSQCRSRRNSLQAGGGAQSGDEEEEGAAWGGRRKMKGRAGERGKSFE